MKRALVVVASVLAVGCASTGLHEGRTALRKEEQGYLVARKGAPTGTFRTVLDRETPVAIGLVRWQEDQSWACGQAPADLLQSMRDEIGRLNQRIVPARTFRWRLRCTASKRAVSGGVTGRSLRAGGARPAGPGGLGGRRQSRGRASLARTLADTSSAIIGREVLRKIRQQFRHLIDE